MNRTLKLPLLVALALGSTSAMALGLGQIRVKSALDQPLLADIPLTADYPGEASHVRVALASAADFKRAGLDRSQIKAHLNFKVITNGKGQRVIRVTSTQPVHATYLDFLLKVSWPKGSMLREFTALLDPQGMAGSQPTPAPTGEPGAGAAAQGSAAAASAESPRTGSSAATSGAAASSARNGEYGPVRSGETLSEIARKAQLQGVTLNQMLMALYKANPGAFYRHNINALKRGAVLRIPSRDQATADSVAAALAAVRRQETDWRNSAAGSPTMVAHAGGRAGSGKAAHGGSANGDHLSLVPPQQGGGGHAQPGVAGGSGNTSVAGLQQNLARTRESLSNAQQENADLHSRVSSLKSINDKNSKLLSLKSAQIAELQQKLAQARKAAGMRAGSAASAASPAAVSPVATGSTATAAAASTAAMANSSNAMLAASGSSSAGAPATALSASAAPTASRSPASQPASQAPAHRAPERPVVQANPWFVRPWSWLAGAVVVIGLLLLAWASSRRKRAEQAQGKPSLADQFGDSPFGSASAVMDGDEAMDVDQRELLAHLAEHPDDVGLHLELVSLYYARSDVEHFEGAAEAMYAHVADPDQPEWQDVIAMGRELTPEHPLFAGEAAQVATPVAGEVDASADNAFDPGDYVSENDAEDIDEDVADDAVSPPHADEETDTTGYSFDFDLTPHHESAAPEGGEVPQAPSEDEYDALPPIPEDEGLEYDGGILPDLHEKPAQGGGAQTDVAYELSSGEAAPLSDDPVDTKLDLARAYIDMGDPEGARAMLDEVMAEGTQMQKDMAGRLLEEVN